MLQESMFPSFFNTTNKIRVLLHQILLVLIIITLSSVSSESITRLSSSTYNNIEFISNNSYRQLFLRQYFISLLNISHSSLIQSMVINRRLMETLEPSHTRKRRSLTKETFSLIPKLKLYSTKCFNINNDQAQSAFQWSHAIESLSAVELIYHMNSNETKASFIPVHISLKEFDTNVEVFSTDSYLSMDFVRDFYAINIYEYLVKLNKSNIIIEATISNQTCTTSYAYIILSSLKFNPLSSYDSQQPAICKLKTIQIKFEELGLAYLIIRPKEYMFTYCDDTCTNLTIQQHLQRSSIYTLMQSIISKNVPNIRQRNCVPSQFANDNFLLRQTDGTIEIYPVKDVIVKQCACL